MQVIYIVERFPTYSETFIHDEIVNHLEKGLDVRVAVLTGPDRSDYSLARCSDTLQQRVTYLDVPAGKAGILVAGISAAARARRLGALVRCRGQSLREILLGSIIAERFPGEAILHCHFGNIGRIGLATQKLSRSHKKLFVTFHAHEMTRSWFLPLNEYYAPLFASTATLLPISNYWRRILVEAGADPDRTVTHHMGVKLAHTARGQALAEEPVKLVMVGRMVPKKGYVTAVEALRLLGQRGISVHCDIIGDGPCREEVSQLAQSYALGDRLKLHGSLPHEETLRLLDCADIFVLPSETATDGDMEGIPVSLMEAMARKIPVVSTYHSGIPELIEDKVSGLLVPERSPEQLADAIASLARDSRLRSRLADAGRQRIETSFNAPAQAEKLQRLYLAA